MAMIRSLAGSFVLAVSLPAQLPTQFVAHTDSVTASKGIAAADVDGDGDVDVIMATLDALIVFVNDGTGRLTPRSTPLASSPNYMLAGDLDGDGDVDLYAGGASVQLALRNDGLGEFAIENLPPTNFLAVSGALVDLDQDGDLDILRSGILSGFDALENVGGGFVVSATLLPAGASTAFKPAFVTGDLNGDGYADVLAYGTPAFTLLSTPTGMVLGSLPPGFPQNGRGVMGDFDGDGAVDVFNVTSPVGSLYVGDGAGGLALSPGTVPSVTLTELVAADLDEDGDLDIAGVEGAFSQTRLVTLLLNDGAGNFVDGTIDRLGVIGDPGAYVAAADLDGDRDVDLFVAGSLLGLAARPDYVLTNRHVHVGVTGPVAVGGTLGVECASRPGYGTGLSLGLIAFGNESPLPLPTPFGELRIQAAGSISLPFVSLPGAQGLAQLNDPVPNDPALIGLEVALQALIVDVFGQTPPRLTNFARIVVQ